MTPDSRQLLHRKTAAPRECYCCGRPESRFRPMLESDKGPVCATDEFCRRGTSAEREGC